MEEKEAETLIRLLGIFLFYVLTTCLCLYGAYMSLSFFWWILVNKI